ncbi:hypothetical protein [Paenisporosarcina sp. TG20]|nr:hypothetical protein [Paenisporosarcina sp. TG20]
MSLAQDVLASTLPQDVANLVEEHFPTCFLELLAFDAFYELVKVT